MDSDPNKVLLTENTGAEYYGSSTKRARIRVIFLGFYYNSPLHWAIQIIRIR